MSAVVEPLFTGLCDDAAVFPPGNLPLEQAVPAHLRHLGAGYSPVVGPLVVAAKDLPVLADVAAGVPARALALAVTTPLPQLVRSLAEAARIPAARPVFVEVALPADTPPDAVVPSLRAALGGTPEVTVFVEIPRDDRRYGVLAALSGTGYLAKFRTGGVQADLYPDEQELAASVRSAVRAGVPFKATAGLHHALRNTDPATGFEQHGFLNLLTATDAALAGADEAELVTLLADRDGSRVAERVRGLTARAREAFRSFGTCSILEPVEELIALGLLDPDLKEDLR